MNPIRWSPPESPIEHGTSRDDDGGKIHATGTHQGGGGGFIAPGQQDHPIQGVGPDRFFHVHAHQVPEQHRGGTHDGLAQRHYRELERESSCLQDSFFYNFCKFPQMSVTRSQIRPGIADANHRTAAEMIVGISLVSEPGPVNKSHFISASEPFPAPEFYFLFSS